MKINKGISILLTTILIGGLNFKVSNAISPSTCIKKLKIGIPWWLSELRIQ